MFRLQQLTTAYLMVEGCTIGLQDMVMPKHILETEIHQIIARTIYEANLITDRLDRGAIIPPLLFLADKFNNSSTIKTPLT